MLFLLEMQATRNDWDTRTVPCCVLNYFFFNFNGTFKTVLLSKQGQQSKLRKWNQLRLEFQKISRSNWILIEFLIQTCSRIFTCRDKSNQIGSGFNWTIQNESKSIKNESKTIKNGQNQSKIDQFNWNGQKDHHF